MYLGWVAGALCPHAVYVSLLQQGLHRKAHAKRRVRHAAGPLLLIIFAVITWYYSLMLVDAYRYPTVDGPTRNYTYIEAVRRYLGARWARGRHVFAACRCAAWLAARVLSCDALAAGFPYMVCCGIVQYVNMFGTGIGCDPHASLHCPRAGQAFSRSIPDVVLAPVLVSFAGFCTRAHGQESWSSPMYAHHVGGPNRYTVTGAISLVCAPAFTPLMHQGLPL